MLKTCAERDEVDLPRPGCTSRDEGDPRERGMRETSEKGMRETSERGMRETLEGGMNETLRLG